jgi:hypothetical protein
MNKLRSPHCPLLTAASAALFFFRCSLTPFSGGGTEGGNVSGLFVNDDGSASAMVQVRLVPADYNPGAVNQGNPVIATATATDGSYSFGRVPKGSYSVEAFNPASGKRSLITGIIVTGEDLHVPADTPRNPGTMKIFLPTSVNPTTGYFFVPGTTIFATINGAGGFITIASVPAATLPALCYSETGSPSIDTIRYRVAVASSDTVVVANPGWKYARRIILNTSPAGAGVSGNVSDFPVLVRLTAGNFNFAQAGTGGSDIRFARSDTVILPYEIEQWDATNGRAVLWVRVDTVFGSDSSQYITLYWGNPGAIASSNSTEVFDTANGFAGVWHMNENPAAGANAIKDRTANSFNATPHGSMNAADVVDAAIGKGLDFDGSNDYLNAGKVALTGSYSVGLWVRLNRINNYQRIIFQDSAYTLWYDSDRSGARMEHIDSSGTWRGMPQDGGVVQPMSTGVWYYLTGTYDGDKIRLYLNGQRVTETNSMVAYPASHGYDLFFGQSWNNSYVNGIMDEVRIEKSARSADWITLCYMNQKSDDKLVVFK